MVHYDDARCNFMMIMHADYYDYDDAARRIAHDAWCMVVIIMHDDYDAWWGQSHDALGMTMLDDSWCMIMMYHDDVLSCRMMTMLSDVCCWW